MPASSAHSVYAAGVLMYLKYNETLEIYVSIEYVFKVYENSNMCLYMYAYLAVQVDDALHVREAMQQQVLSHFKICHACH